MDNLDIAIHNTIHSDTHSCARIAKSLGMSAQVLRNKANPESESHKLNIRETIAIMELMGDFQILEAIQAEVLIPEEDSKVSIVELILDVNAKVGEVSNSFKSVLAGGRMTPKTQNLLDRTLSSAGQAIKAARSKLETIKTEELGA